MSAEPSTRQRPGVGMTSRVVRKEGPRPARRLRADVCVLGAGISGVATALELTRLGREVLLLDGLPAIGGQAVHSIVGTFCGLFANGSHGPRFTHGIADDLLGELGDQGALNYRHGPMTTTVMYDEEALSRWVDRHIVDEGVTTVAGAVLLGVRREGRRIVGLDLATRFGALAVDAAGFVDASGDAALAWEAGLPCREPDDGPIYGTQMLVLEGIDEDHAPGREEVSDVLRRRGRDYGLERRDGFAFSFTGRGIALVNMTHVETPLDPVALSANALAGKLEAGKAFDFLRGEFPACFTPARIRSMGLPGIRQTRWIVGAHQITADEVRTGVRFPDAVARTAWPIELHNAPEGYVWEPFDVDHVHYVPYSAMTPPEVDNLIAVGRCVDGDPAALSSVRVMGPCMAMGTAAAHALDLADGGSLHAVEVAALQARVRENLE